MTQLKFSNQRQKAESAVNEGPLMNLSQESLSFGGSKSIDSLFWIHRKREAKP